MIRPRTLLPLLGAALALCAVAPAAHALDFGMGDQKPRMFTDPRFQALGIERVRIVVDWDVALVAGPELERLDAWLGAARAHGKEPQIAFTDAHARPRHLPSVGDYEQAFAALRARFPWVRLYTTWNEGNLNSQPTADAPEQVARYFDVIRARCGECTVIAADVLDQSDMVAWVQRVRVAVTAGEPQVTGVHNYVEVNRPERTGTTAALLAAVPGAVWLTETGGIVKHASPAGRVNWAYDEQRAAQATARAIRIARSDARIERIYLYQWSVDAYERWDSAFIGPAGEERPSLNVLREALVYPLGLLRGHAMPGGPQRVGRAPVRAAAALAGPLLAPAVQPARLSR